MTCVAAYCTEIETPYTIADRAPGCPTTPEMASHRASQLLLLAAVLAAALMCSAEAQSTPACAQQLVPCANYMNSTNPPPSCCNPIKQAVATERDCLCNLYNTPGLLQSFGINVTQALRLTKACGVDANTGLCNDSAPAPTAGSTTPATPGNDAGRVMWSGLTGLLLVWASMLLYWATA